MKHHQRLLINAPSVRVPIAMVRIVVRSSSHPRQAQRLIANPGVRFGKTVIASPADGRRRERWKQ
jgi:hypothetical protein